jgi:N-formylglutamate deformylase
MPHTYTFLISVPHGGVEVPEEVRNTVFLDEETISYFSDPGTRKIFDLADRVDAYIDTPISRMIVDLNRPPYHLPPKRWDGVVKTRTATGIPVYKEGHSPDITLIHRLLMKYYFPYHAMLDRLLESGRIIMAFDCHSMLPVAPEEDRDSGRKRPLVCLGNNGDKDGNPRKGTLATCRGETIRALSDEFRKIYPAEGSVAMNTPFRGGFISNAHYWHKGVPWVQLEVNRSLYEGKGKNGVIELQDNIREVLSGFWKEIQRNKFL